MKLDAIKHQGQTCGQVGHKSRDALSDSDSGRQIQRYIRLTELIPEILDMVDNGQIKFNPAVELSYLAREEQQDFLSAMDFAQAAPSLSQAQRIKKLAQEGECTLDAMCEIMNEVKKGELDRVTFKTDSLRKYFPKSYTSKQIDCMPSLGMVTINALSASDSVIIPVQAQYLPAKGMTQLVQTISRVKKRINPNLKIDGIQNTKDNGIVPISGKASIDYR